MKRATLLLAASVAALAAPGCAERSRVGPPEPTCDAAVLAASLSRAEPGGLVLVDRCAVEGSFVVPAGVTLRGEGPGLSRLLSAGTEPVLTLETGSETTGAVGLTVESGACAAVLVDGTGGASLEDVEVVSSRGVGLLAEGLESLELSRVRLVGPVTAETAGELSFDPTPSETATHGLALLRVASATLGSVEVAGFARTGALLAGSDVAVRQGSFSDNLRLGLFAVGGRLRLEEVEVSRTLDSTDLVPAMAGLFVGEAEVTTEAVTVEGGAGLGFYHATGRAHHVDLVARGNEDIALSAHGCAEVVVEGARSEIAGNGTAGLFVTGSGRTALRGLRVRGTLLSPAVFGETGLIEVGDGVQLLEPAGPVELVDLELGGNGRVQALLDLGDREDVDLRIEGVVVDGEGDQLGAILQAAPGQDGWDDRVSRRGATAANDSDFAGELPTLAVPTVETVDPDAYTRASVLGGCE